MHKTMKFETAYNRVKAWLLKDVEPVDGGNAREQKAFDALWWLTEETTHFMRDGRIITGGLLVGPGETIDSTIDAFGMHRSQIVGAEVIGRFTLLTIANDGAE